MLNDSSPITGFVAALAVVLGGGFRARAPSASIALPTAGGFLSTLYRFGTKSGHRHDVTDSTRAHHRGRCRCGRLCATKARYTLDGLAPAAFPHRLDAGRVDAAADEAVDGRVKQSILAF